MPTRLVWAMGGEDLVEVARRVCSWCRSVFGVCPGCFRGQRYCCGDCREKAQEQQHREDQAKYQRTDSGRRKHAERERRYRERQEFLGVTEAASVVDGPSAPSRPSRDAAPP